MSFNLFSVAEQIHCPRSFTISQAAPGALLEFEPPLHSKELAEAINSYIPGHSTLQEKKRRIVSDFCIWRSQVCPEGPASHLYDASPALNFSAFTGVELPSVEHVAPSKQISAKYAMRSNAKVVKRTPKKATSSGPRLPGLSIMTKDGFDVTDTTSRGPKTKEQREHAALMRKLGVCATCKKRKQRCNPSHHIQTKSSSSPSPAKSLSPESLVSTPASLAVSGKRPAHFQSQEMQISHTGQHLPGANLPAKTALTPSDFASSDFGAFNASPSMPSTLDPASLDTSMDPSAPSFFDTSMLSNPFDDTLDLFSDDSFLYFNNWSNCQRGSQGGSSYSSIPAPSQFSKQDGSVFTDIIPSSTNVLTTLNYSGASQFSDFVPTWGSGSTPYVPMDGSTLQSPDEFGMQIDITRTRHSDSQLGQLVQSSPKEGHQSLQLHPQMHDLFGEYAPSDIPSPGIFNPTSMSTISSSQGQSSSLYGTPFPAGQNTTLQPSYSPRVPVSVHANTLQPRGVGSNAESPFQGQVFDPAQAHPRRSVGGSLDRYGNLTSPAQGSGPTPDLSQRQAAASVYARSQMGFPQDTIQSSTSSPTLRIFDGTDSSSVVSADMSNLYATRSAASGFQSRIAGSSDELQGAVFVLSAQFLENYNSQLQQGSQDSSEPFLGASLSQAIAANGPHNNDAAPRESQVLPTEVERPGGRVCYLEQEQRPVDSKFTLLFARPRDQHTRQSRSRQVEDSLSAHAGVLDRSSHDVSATFGNDRYGLMDDLSTAGDISRQDFVPRQNALHASQAESAEDFSRCLLNSPPARRNRSANFEDREALRTGAHHQAGGIQSNADSYPVATRQRPLHTSNTDDTQLQPSLALRDLVLLSALTLIASLFDLNPLNIFLAIIAAVFLRTKIISSAPAAHATPYKGYVENCLKSLGAIGSTLLRRLQSPTNQLRSSCARPAVIR